MADNVQISAENCAHEPETLEAVLARLTLDQIRFVIARLECATSREAARKIHLSESTVYRWGPDVDTALRLMAQDGLVTALHIRRRMLAKAMAVKAAGLDSADEKIRQSAATEIIEWELGRATQKQEVSGPGGQPVQVSHNFDFTDDQIADILSILAGAGALQPGAEEGGDTETQ